LQQLAVDQVFLGMMAELRIADAVLQHPAQCLEVRALGALEAQKLLLEEAQQPGHVAMLVVQALQRCHHRGSPRRIDLAASNHGKALESLH
jgi:hypothetical protein